MKTYLGFMMLALAVVLMGCNNAEEGGDANNEGGTSTSQNDTDNGTTKVSLENDLCAKCGCCAGCDDCCEGKKCEGCGMQEGSELCCTGVKPAEGVYCKGCGFTKGSEDCCKESNETCTSCNLAKGSPLCCKIKSEEEAE
ncbi:MAG: hypothetical protein AAFN77_10985 [Planctomycetota bacterium]